MKAIIANKGDHVEMELADMPAIQSTVQMGKLDFHFETEADAILYCRMHKLPYEIAQ